MENTLLGHDAGRIDNVTGEPHPDTIHDHIFVNKLVYRYSEPQRGDIIVFRAPKEADAEHPNLDDKVENVLIKRCIGVPNDTIEVKEGAVYLNGKRQEEYHNPIGSYPYSIKDPMREGLESIFKYAGPGRPVTLKPGQLWVMGDNRNDSNDSRYWGPLDRDRVIGKASFIFWPLDRIRLLH
jgi:signal peptidase I